MTLAQIIPNIFTFTNQMIGCVYLVTDPDGLTLIDTGAAAMTRIMLRSLQRGGFRAEDIRRIVITHAHPDHASNLPLLKKITGAQIYASEREKDVIEGRCPMESIYIGKARTAPKWLPELFLSPCRLDHPLRDGDRIPFLGGTAAIATPGHTIGHTSYWQPGLGILFCGDVLIRFPYTRLPFALFTRDMRENIRSLIKISQLEPKIILPGHGKPVVQKAAAHLTSFAATKAVEVGMPFRSY